MNPFINYVFVYKNQNLYINFNPFLSDFEFDLDSVSI